MLLCIAELYIYVYLYVYANYTVTFSTKFVTQMSKTLEERKNMNDVKIVIYISIEFSFFSQNKVYLQYIIGRRERQTIRKAK